MIFECKTILLFLLLLADVSTADISNNQTNSSINQTDSFYPINQSPTFSPCQQPIILRYKLFVYFCVVVLIVALVGNSVSIFVILSSRRLRSQVAFHFLVSLAMADIGVSLFVTPLSVNKYLHNNNFCHSRAACLYFTFADYIFNMASVTHLLIVAIDRFTAIKFPFMYSTHFTKRKVAIIIVFIWCYVVLWAGSGLLPWRENEQRVVVELKGEGRYCHSKNNRGYVTAFAVIIYFVPMVVTTVLYCIILFIAMQHANTIRQQIPASLNETASLKGAKQKNRRLKRDLRAAKTISFVFIAYSVCWLPHFIMAMLGYWNLDMIRRFVQDNRQAYDVVATIFHNVLPPLNCCLNPFIYFLFGANFRSAFKEVLYKVLKKPRDASLYRDDSQFVPNSRRNSASSKIEPTDEKTTKEFNNNLLKVLPSHGNKNR